MTQDRRQHPRLIPDSALLVSVNRLRRVVLSDLSESGMAFDGWVGKSNPKVLSLAFDLPDGGGSVATIAEVVWTCDSLRRTGVRFAELSQDCRRRLREWLSARVVMLESKQDGAPGNSLSAVTASTREWMLREIAGEPAPEQVSAGTLIAPESHAAADVIDRGTSYQTIGIILCLVVVSATFVTLGYYLPAWVPSSRENGHISTWDSPIPVSSHGSMTHVNQVSGAGPGAATASGAKYEGFALQVGAMARKENADALAEKLRQKSFPAFVSDRARDGLYRVDVGPYPDAGYARGVSSELRSAGFGTVLERRITR
jgi:hypothetical protein